jgi:serine/threonine protein kinase
LGDDNYSLYVETWNVGCIFAELFRREPLFVGYNDFKMLTTIFNLVGTPNEEVCLGVSQLSYWHPFPHWNPTDLRTNFMYLDENAFNFLSKLLEYNPSKRIYAKCDLLHPYFFKLSKA